MSEIYAVRLSLSPFSWALRGRFPWGMPPFTAWEPIRRRSSIRAACPSGSLSGRGVFAGLAAFIIGKLMPRLRGHVLTITTAFFGVLVAVVMNNWIPTNGPMGITGIPRPSPFSFLGMNIALESRTDYYFLGLVFIAGVIYFLWRMKTHGSVTP